MPSPELFVACLCAQWCGTCRDYRATFDRVQAEFQAEFATTRFVWIDIEDEAELVDPIEVETFPTLLIASDRGPHFFGPLTPQPETLRWLVQQHLSHQGSALVADPAIAALLARLRT